MRRGFTGRGGRLVAGVALAALVTSCSSSLSPTDTIAGSGDAAPEVVAGEVQLDPGAPASAPGDEAGTAPGPESSVATGAGDAGAVDAPAAAAPGGAAAASGQAAPGSKPPAGAQPAPPIPFSQGVTPTTIRIGVFIASYAGLEAKGLRMGDPELQAQAVADVINARGGIAGRKIVLSYAKLEAGSSNWESDEQKICTTFTEDHKVFAVIYSLVSQGNTLLPCLAKHNTPLISGVGGVADKQLMDQYADFYYYAGGPELTRMAKMYVDGLHAQGFFGGAGEIGLVRLDSAPFERAAKSSLRPALAAHGFKIAEEAIVDAQTSLSKTASQMPSIVLKFQQRDIKKVLFLDNATLATLFATQAASQGYYPAYGLTSLSAPGALMQQNVPKEALLSTKGVGWSPALDVDTTRDADNPNPAARTCKEIMRKAGQGDVGSAGVSQQRMFCDELMLLERALNSAAEITPRGLRQQVEGFGASFKSALTFAARFGPGRHDGAAAVRLLAFDGGCSCFQYTSPPRSVG